MQQRLWIAFALFAGISFAIQVSWPVDLEDLPETTYDTAPRGHAAVLALLEGFDATPGRWLSGLSMPPVEESIWWISPQGACELRETPSDDEDVSETAARLRSVFRFSVRPWIEAGGTALVWLSQPPLSPPDDLDDGDGEERLEVFRRVSDVTSEPSEPSEQDEVREDWQRGLAEARSDVREGTAQRCDAIMGFPLPPRRLAGLENGLPPEPDRSAPVAFSIGRAPASPEAFDWDATRILPGPTLAFFENPPADGPAMQGWRPIWVDSNDRVPFALERKVGEGRLIVLADARVLSNGRLGVVDSAPFVFDFVRDYGRPWFDEHAHGVVPESGTFRYLATSPAWAAGLGMLAIGALVVWRGQAWPTRTVSEVDPNAPTLSAFVDSVARLYSGTRDHGHVFERYRALCLDRIRRALGLGPGTSAEIILASLRTRAKGWPQLRDAGLAHLLTRQISIANADDLERNASRLDDLVRVLRSQRESGQGGASDAPLEAGRSATRREDR